MTLATAFSVVVYILVNLAHVKLSGFGSTPNEFIYLIEHLDFAAGDTNT